MALKRKLKIEEAAARTQARIDSGFQTVIGVNSYKLNVKENVPVLKIDNSKVRSAQIERLNKLKQMRDQTLVDKSLNDFLFLIYLDLIL